MLLNNEWVNNEIKEEIKSSLETKESEPQDPKSVGHSKSSPKRKSHSITGLVQETRKISSKQSNCTHRRTRKRTTKPKVSRRKEIIKNRREINESLKTIKKPQ